MVNRLQTKRSDETIKKIKESLRKKYKEQGGMSPSVKDKISKQMLKNWQLKREEEAKIKVETKNQEENNELNTDQDERQ